MGCFCLFIQIQLRVTDGGSPPQSAEFSTQVIVDRNLFAPLFEEKRQEKTLLETNPIGEIIAVCDATDEDTKVC